MLLVSSVCGPSSLQLPVDATLHIDKGAKYNVDENKPAKKPHEIIWYILAQSFFFFGVSFLTSIQYEPYLSWVSLLPHLRVDTMSEKKLRCH